MAVWLREHNRLTQQGKGILSKLQAGIGEMTITRIVAGGGYVSSFDLEDQMEVTDPFAEFTIIAKETTTEGSGIEISMTNETLTEQKTLYQIGVYVTHTDYAELVEVYDTDGITVIGYEKKLVEMLYMLVQSSLTYSDVIPAFDLMPITLSYSLWLYHGDIPDGTLVVININMAGYIPLHFVGKSLGVAPLNLDNIVPEKHLPNGVVLLHEHLPDSTEMIDGILYVVISDDTHLDDYGKPSPTVYKSVNGDWVFVRVFGEGVLAHGIELSSNDLPAIGIKAHWYITGYADYFRPDFEPPEIIEMEQALVKDQETEDIFPAAANDGVDFYPTLVVKPK